MTEAPRQLIEWIRKYSNSGISTSSGKKFIEVSDYDTLLITIGNSEEYYITLDDNKLYRWTGSTYVEVSSNNKDDMTLDFTGVLLTYTFYAPFTMQIDSVTNVLNAPTTTITKNASPYTLGTSIALGNTIVVTVDTSSVVRLNYTKL